MTSPSLREISFPNGLRLLCLPKSQAETRYVYHEIFEAKTYSRHGIKILDGDCVVDVGANIGMFVVSAMRSCRDLRIYAFEPVPPIFAALQANVQRTQASHAAKVSLFPHGISDRHAHQEITFFPQSPANSTLFPADKQRDQNTKAAAIQLRDVWKYDKLAFLVLAALYPLRHRLIEYRLWQLYKQGKTFHAEFKPLSAIIDEQGLSSVDLLKVDVEGSEIDVLAGIEDRHWGRIKQLVLELAPHNAQRAGEVREMLQQRGFRNLAVETMGQEKYVEGSRLACNVYATR